MADPLWIDAVAGAPEYGANELRQAMALPLAYDGRLLGARQGVRPGGAQLQVSLASSTITVQPGLCCLDPGLSTAQGPYWVAIPAAETHTLTAANATNPRKDIVVVRVYDHVEDGSGLRLARSEYLAGTAGPSPAEPAVPAGAIRVATIDVPASGGGAAVVTDRRPWTVAAGGILPVADQSARNALAAYPGQYVHRLDSGELQVWTGTQWQWRAGLQPSLESTTEVTPQTVAASTTTVMRWQTPSENVGTFGKPNTTDFTVPADGIYLATLRGEVNNAQSGRAFFELSLAGRMFRSSFGGVGENAGAVTGQRRLTAGNTITVSVFCATATTMRPSTLVVCRIGA